ncbi:MAG: helix-turn-helix domain-containing protein [Lachnospiraceae bacterium]|nr:helix-turn-helix domain-containing protein [Lachnospiraceae bacterium]
MLSEKLRYLRKSKGVSQEELAEKLCVVRQTISKWEKGWSVPDAEMLLKIAEALDIPVNDILNETMECAEEKETMKYDVIIIGAGPGGIFAAYELMQHKSELRVAVFEAGHELKKRHCPIDGDKIKTCIGCKSCSIMSGFGGAGAFSDGKYNITNDFGGTLYEYIGKKRALDLMHYVDEINMKYGGAGTKLYSTAGTKFKKLCIENDLHLLDASVRHLGTDINYVVLEQLYAYLQDKVDFYFDTPVETVSVLDDGYEITCARGTFDCSQCVISVGRSGSKWMEHVCRELDIPTRSNRVDIGVRVELPAEVFSHLTDELYESKIVYRTEKYGDKVRTFCMNPKGAVVNENTNGIITVNGHSYEDPAMQTGNTNFALLVAKHFSEPFKDSNGYGESIARLSNMLGGGVIVQRFGDLIRGRRSTQNRIEESFVTPTLNATPGDLSLVLPKRILDGIIEMIYALDKVAPGTANDDTLLYGVEVKFYNMEVEVNEQLMCRYDGLYIIGDGSGITHSLSHASASGVHVARDIVASDGRAEE